MRTATFWLVALLAMASTTQAQRRAEQPYIGFVYPAGGRQGTTFQIKLGGQDLADINGVLISGKGVSARVLEYQRDLRFPDMELLQEQEQRLRQNRPAGGEAAPRSAKAMISKTPHSGPAAAKADDDARILARIEKRMAEWVRRPASDSIANLVYAEVTLTADAPPGQREIRLLTPHGVSNPIVFQVGQLPEVSRKPMLTSHFPVLGKEQQALRHRPASEIEDQIQLPCVANGQVAPGETNRYRFHARQGQRLVISVRARQLIPYIADAVPGWFQPVIALYDAEGTEVAYDDDYRLQPDPVILYQVPHDGKYVVAIYDALYRGREDFVYRMTIGELPFVTSIFPLGGRVGSAVIVNLRGWNLATEALTLSGAKALPGVASIATTSEGIFSNRVPFAWGTPREDFEKEPNNDQAHAQKITIPVIINGRIDRPDDWDVFQFSGSAGQPIVAEVYARRLGSPLDSILKLTDASGKVLALNDDYEDPEAGVNTHDADSYLSVTLPADGTYYLHLGDSNRNGGEEYAYRLRISWPQPDFAVRVVPSSLSLRRSSSGAVSVYAVRKEGFAAPIKVSLKNPPPGFNCDPVTLGPKQDSAKLLVKTTLRETEEPVSLVFEGSAEGIRGEITHLASPAEDRIQAFLWRHLVPAQDLKAVVFSPAYQPPSKRVRRATTPSSQPSASTEDKPPATAGPQPKLSKGLIWYRLRLLKLLYEENLLADEFYDEKVKECEAAQ
jgi:hypothetical protein